MLWAKGEGRGKRRGKWVRVRWSADRRGGEEQRLMQKESEEAREQARMEARREEETKRHGRVGKRARRSGRREREHLRLLRPQRPRLVRYWQVCNASARALHDSTESSYLVPGLTSCWTGGAESR